MNGYTDAPTFAPTLSYSGPTVTPTISVKTLLALPTSSMTWFDHLRMTYYNVWDKYNFHSSTYDSNFTYAVLGYDIKLVELMLACQLASATIANKCAAYNNLNPSIYYGAKTITSLLDTVRPLVLFWKHYSIADTTLEILKLPESVLEDQHRYGIGVVALPTFLHTGLAGYILAKHCFNTGYFAMQTLKSTVKNVVNSFYNTNSNIPSEIISAEQQSTAQEIEHTPKTEELADTTSALPEDVQAESLAPQTPEHNITQSLRTITHRLTVVAYTAGIISTLNAVQHLITIGEQDYNTDIKISGNFLYPMIIGSIGNLITLDSKVNILYKDSLYFANKVSEYTMPAITSMKHGICRVASNTKNTFLGFIYRTDVNTSSKDKPTTSGSTSKLTKDKSKQLLPVNKPR